jgi:photosystem II stability/assembly factor-like uncharacterized protein
MIMHILKALGTAAAACVLLCLIGGQSMGAALEVPAGFEPASASFVSPALGVVLGGSGCTINRACRARLALTTDGGARWSAMNAPDTSLANPRLSVPQVSQVLFATSADGWLYDQYSSDRVWVTHDGGASWRLISLPGIVTAMSASAHTVYAVAGDRLYRSPAGQDAWTPANPSGHMTGSVLAVRGNSVWLGNGTYVWTSADGVHWARYPLHSPGTAFGVPYSLAGIAAAGPDDVAFLWGSAQGTFHTAMRVQISFNQGKTARPTPQSPPLEGDIAGFAAAPGRFGVLLVPVVTPGEDLIYRSASLGKSWTTFGTPHTDGGVALNSLQFMSSAAAVYVVGNPGFGEPGYLLVTGNAGATWHPVTF